MSEKKWWKKQHHRIQESRNWVIKSGAVEKTVKYFQNFLLFAFSLTFEQQRDSPVPGKIFTDPIAAAFLYPYASAGAVHLTHEKFSIAVICGRFCLGWVITPSGTNLNFLSLKTFPELSTYTALPLCQWVACRPPGRAEASFWDVFSGLEATVWAWPQNGIPGADVGPPFCDQVVSDLRRLQLSHPLTSCFNDNGVTRTELPSSLRLSPGVQPRAVFASCAQLWDKLPEGWQVAQKEVTMLGTWSGHLGTVVSSAPLSGGEQASSTPAGLGMVAKGGCWGPQSGTTRQGWWEQSCFWLCSPCLKKRTVSHPNSSMQPQSSLA